MAQDMRRAPVQPTVSQPAAPAMNSGAMAMAPRSSSKLPWVILAIIVVVLVVVGFLFRDSLFGSKGEVKGDFTNDKYQAVFLTNGQVYFGKLKDVQDQYITLTGIYYLQVSSAAGTTAQASSADAQQQGQLTLVQLGKELHGPEDEMKINRDQVLFYENIKEDGKVMQAIRCNQKDPSGQTCGDQSQAQPQTQAPSGSAVNGANTGTTRTNSNANSNR